MAKQIAIIVTPARAGAARNGPESDTELTATNGILTATSSEQYSENFEHQLSSGRGDESGASQRQLPDRPAWIRVRKLALRQLNRLVSLEHQVLRGESPKAVHDLRVASRRLQSLLD